MDYYRDIVTAKSWNLLQDFARKYRFILIGGWAVWLYTKRLKSKDIDIFINPQQLFRLKEDFPQLTKNDRLKKYEIIQEEIHIDIYVPYYSNLGVAGNDIQSHSVAKEGFTVPTVPVLLLLKLVAYSARRGSSKGQKDLLDIISLLSLSEFNWRDFLSLSRNNEKEQIREMITSHTAFPELGLTPHSFSKLKKKVMDGME